MRVAIIAPPYPLAEAPAPPLGVTYVAAAFEAAGAEVQIFDYIVSCYTPEKLAAALDAFQPDVVGATSVTLNFPAAAAIIGDVKAHNPSIVTMMGGPHVSFDALNSLERYPEIDLIVMGEGEATIAELVPVIGDRRAWYRVRGIAFRDGGQITINEPRPWIDNLDTLPLPARHLLPLSKYRGLGFPISITTSRGCPYGCIFCQGRRMVGSKIRYRSPALVIAEIENILSYGIDRINVADDLFASNKDRVREICTAIADKKLKFSWSAFARVNTVDKETLRMMRRAGCDSISFGVESGNQEMLDRIKKGITLEKVRKAVDCCREVGLTAHTSFIVGLPGESPATLQDTKRFARSLGSLYGYHFLAPFPGTTVRERIEEYDLEILTDDWSRYDANSAIVRTSQLSAEDMNRFVADFDREIDKAWQKMVQGYYQRTNYPQDDMKVEGHFRTQLIYQILSEDLVEAFGVFPIDALGYETANMLAIRIEEHTAAEPALVRKVIADFVERGYIKSVLSKGQIAWYWTRNNTRDR